MQLAVQVRPAERGQARQQLRGLRGSRASTGPSRPSATNHDRRSPVRGREHWTGGAAATAGGIEQQLLQVCSHGTGRTASPSRAAARPRSWNTLACCTQSGSTVPTPSHTESGPPVSTKGRGRGRLRGQCRGAAASPAAVEGHAQHHRPRTEIVARLAQFPRAQQLPSTTGRPITPAGRLVMRSTAAVSQDLSTSNENSHAPEPPPTRQNRQGQAATDPGDNTVNRRGPERVQVRGEAELVLTIHRGGST